MSNVDNDPNFAAEPGVEQDPATAAEPATMTPEGPGALRELLETLSRQRKDDEIFAVIAQLERRNMLPADSLIFALRARFRSGEYSTALKIIDRILNDADDNVEALRTGGRIGNLTRDDDVALKHWQRLALVSPADQEAALQVARIQFRGARYAEALDWARRASMVPRESDEALRIAVEAGLEVGWPEECDRLLVRLIVGDRTRGLKSISRLVATFETSIAARALAALRQQFPSDAELADLADKTCSRWLVAGMERELASRDLEAAVYFGALRRVRPGDVQVRRAIERLSMPSLLAMRDALGARDFAGAKAHGTMVTRIDPDNLEAWQAVGRAEFGSGDAAGARDAFRRCTELKAEDARMWLTYGLTLNQTGERPAALAAFQKALELGTDPEARREAEASIGALFPGLVQDANDAAARGDIEAAWTCFASVAAARLDDGETERLRKLLLRQSRDRIRQLWSTKSREAVPLCRLYLDQSPDDAYVMMVFGRSLMETRAHGEALPIWERLSAGDARNGHLHLQIARCCRSLKLVEKGRSAAAEALRLDPGLQEAAAISEYLAGLRPDGDGR